MDVDRDEGGSGFRQGELKIKGQAERQSKREQEPREV